MRTLQNAITLDDNSTHSDKVYNTGAICCSVASLALLIGCLITYIISDSIGLIIWQSLFYPILIFDVVAIYLSFAQLLRNRYFSILISSCISALVMICLIVVIILQIVILKKLYIIPFVYL